MTKTYDPKDVSVVVNGRVITGFADGTFINASKETENYIPHVGAQGEVSRAVNANPLGKITLTLKSTSPSNSEMNRLAKSKAIFPARVIDRNDGSLAAGGSECWVEKPANIEYGAEVTSREWVIVVADYDVNMN